MEIPIPRETVFILRRDLAGFFVIVVLTSSGPDAGWLHGCPAPRWLSVGYVVLCDVTACTWNGQAGLNTLWPKKNDRHLANDILNEFSCMTISVFSFKFHWKLFRMIYFNDTASIQMIPWQRKGDKSLTERMMAYCTIVPSKSDPVAVIDIFRMWPLWAENTHTHTEKQKKQKISRVIFQSD